MRHRARSTRVSSSIIHRRRELETTHRPSAGEQISRPWPGHTMKYHPPSKKKDRRAVAFSPDGSPVCYTEGDMADSKAPRAHLQDSGKGKTTGWRAHPQVPGARRGGGGGRPQKGTGGLLGGTAGVLSVDPSWRHKPACLSKQLYAKKKKKHNFMLKTVRLLYVNDTWRVGNKPEGRAGTLCPCKEISKKHCPATSSPLRPGCKAVQGGRENTRTRVCFCRSGSRAGTRPRGAGP